MSKLHNKHRLDEEDAVEIGSISGGNTKTQASIFDIQVPQNDDNEFTFDEENILSPQRYERSLKKQAKVDQQVNNYDQKYSKPSVITRKILNDKLNKDIKPMKSTQNKKDKQIQILTSFTKKKMNDNDQLNSNKYARSQSSKNQNTTLTSGKNQNGVLTQSSLKIRPSSANKQRQNDQNNQLSSYQSLQMLQKKMPKDGNTKQSRERQILTSSELNKTSSPQGYITSKSNYNIPTLTTKSRIVSAQKKSNIFNKNMQNQKTQLKQSNYSNLLNSNKDFNTLNNNDIKCAQIPSSNSPCKIKLVKKVQTNNFMNPPSSSGLNTKQLSQKQCEYNARSKLRTQQSNRELNNLSILNRSVEILKNRYLTHSKDGQTSSECTTTKQRAPGGVKNRFKTPNNQGLVNKSLLNDDIKSQKQDDLNRKGKKMRPKSSMGASALKLYGYNKGQRDRGNKVRSNTRSGKNRKSNDSQSSRSQYYTQKDKEVNRYQNSKKKVNRQKERPKSAINKGRNEGLRKNYVTTFVISEQEGSSGSCASALFNENDNKYDYDSSSLENERLTYNQNRQNQNQYNPQKMDSYLNQNIQSQNSNQRGQTQGDLSIPKLFSQNHIQNLTMNVSQGPDFEVNNQSNSPNLLFNASPDFQNLQQTVNQPQNNNLTHQQRQNETNENTRQQVSGDYRNTQRLAVSDVLNQILPTFQDQVNLINQRYDQEEESDRVEIIQPVRQNRKPPAPLNFQINKNKTYETCTEIIGQDQSIKQNTQGKLSSYQLQINDVNNEQQKEKELEDKIKDFQRQLRQIQKKKQERSGSQHSQPSSMSNMQITQQRSRSIHQLPQSGLISDKMLFQNQQDETGQINSRNKNISINTQNPLNIDLQKSSFRIPSQSSLKSNKSSRKLVIKLSGDKQSVKNKFARQTTFQQNQNDYTSQLRGHQQHSIPMKMKKNKESIKELTNQHNQQAFSSWCGSTSQEKTPILHDTNMRNEESKQNYNITFTNNQSSQPQTVYDYLSSIRTDKHINQVNTDINEVLNTRYRTSKLLQRVQTPKVKQVEIEIPCISQSSQSISYEIQSSQTVPIQQQQVPTQQEQSNEVYVNIQNNQILQYSSQTHFSDANSSASVPFLSEKNYHTDFQRQLTKHFYQSPRKIGALDYKKQTNLIKPTNLEKFIDYLSNSTLINKSLNYQPLIIYGDSQKFKQQFDDYKGEEILKNEQIQKEKLLSLEEGKIFVQSLITLHPKSFNYIVTSEFTILSKDPLKDKLNLYLNHLDNQFKAIHYKKNLYMQYQVQQQDENILTRKLNECLVEVKDYVNRQNIIDQSKNAQQKKIKNKIRPIKFYKQNFMQKLININDLEFNQKNTQNNLKQELRKEELKKQEDELENKEILLKYKPFILNNHSQIMLLKIHSSVQGIQNSNFFMHEETNLKARFKDEIKQIESKKKKNIMLERFLSHFKVSINFLMNDANYINQQKFMDSVWRNKLNKCAFVELGDNSLIDKLDQQVPLSDIQQHVNNYPRMHKQFDWEYFEQQANLFYKRKFNSYPLSRRYTMYINSQNVNNTRTIIFTRVPELVLQKTFKSAFKNLDSQHLNFNVKVSILPKDSQKCIHELIEKQKDTRYNDIQQLMAKKVRESIDQGYHLSEWVDEKTQYLQKYKDTITSKMLQEDHESLNFIFGIDQCSNITEKIYDKDLSLRVIFVMNDLLQINTKGNLHVKPIFGEQLFKEINFGERQKEQIQEPIRSKCKDLHQLKWDTTHQVQQYDLFGFMKDFKKQALCTSREWERQWPGKKNPYLRQSALKLYDQQYCEYLIQLKLQKHILRMKDVMNIFYKKSAGLIWKTDSHYNLMCHEFNYKCCLTRQDVNSKEIMEVYIPILETKALSKIAKMNESNQKNNKKDEKLQTTPTCAHALNKMKSFNEKETRKKGMPLYTKIYKAISQDVFETDDEMKDLNFNEINSCSDDEVDQQKITAAKNKLINLLAEFPCAYDYYKKIQYKKKAAKSPNVIKKLKAFRILDQDDIEYKNNMSILTAGQKNTQNKQNSMILKTVNDVYKEDYKSLKELIQKNKELMNHREVVISHYQDFETYQNSKQGLFIERIVSKQSFRIEYVTRKYSDNNKSIFEKDLVELEKNKQMEESKKIVKKYKKKLDQSYSIQSANKLQKIVNRFEIVEGNPTIEALQDKNGSNYFQSFFKNIQNYVDEDQPSKSISQEKQEPEQIDKLEKIKKDKKDNKEKQLSVKQTFKSDFNKKTNFQNKMMSLLKQQKKYANTEDKLYQNDSSLESLSSVSSADSLQQSKFLLNNETKILNNIENSSNKNSKIDQQMLKLIQISGNILTDCRLKKKIKKNNKYINNKDMSHEENTQFQIQQMAKDLTDIAKILTQILKKNHSHAEVPNQWEIFKSIELPNVENTQQVVKYLSFYNTNFRQDKVREKALTIEVAISKEKERLKNFSLKHEHDVPKVHVCSATIEQKLRDQQQSYNEKTKHTQLHFQYSPMELLKDKFRVNLPYIEYTTKDIHHIDMEQIANVSNDKLTFDQIIQKSYITLDNNKVKEKITDAILTQNCGMMYDLVDRYGKNSQLFSQVMDENENNLLMMAVIFANPDMIEILIKSGIDPDDQNKDGNTAFHYAVGLQRLQCVDVLINQIHVNETITNKLGLGPWELTDGAHSMHQELHRVHHKEIKLKGLEDM